MATSAGAHRSTAFANLSLPDKVARLQDRYPVKAAAFEQLIDCVWDEEEHDRRSRAVRQARASLKKE